MAWVGMVVTGNAQNTDASSITTPADIVPLVIVIASKGVITILSAVIGGGELI